MELGFRSRPEASHAPPLPSPEGPLSSLVIDTITADGEREGQGYEAAETVRRIGQPMADPLADQDLQLSLNLCYELHYLSFRGVETAWEWDPGMLELRAELERVFTRGIARAIEPEPDIRPDEIGNRLLSLKPDPEPGGLIDHLAVEADLNQTRELVVHRSPVRLRQPDRCGWTMARLRGRPRRALAKLQKDSLPRRTLYSRAMREIDLDDRDGAYLDLLPGSTLAEVNLISFLGLHRRNRGAMLGQIAMQEILSPAEDRASATAMRRLGLDDAAWEYFDESTASSEKLKSAAVFEMAEGMARLDPTLGPDIMLGARSLLAVQKRLIGRVMERWRLGASSLLAERPLQHPG